MSQRRTFLSAIMGDSVIAAAMHSTLLAMNEIVSQMYETPQGEGGGERTHDCIEADFEMVDRTAQLSECTD